MLAHQYSVLEEKRAILLLIVGLRASRQAGKQAAGKQAAGRQAGRQADEIRVEFVRILYLLNYLGIYFV